MERPQPARVTRASGQRDVNGASRARTLPGFGCKAGAGEQRVRMLVHADRQHARIGVKGRQHPIGVMHVQVDVGDPAGALPEQPLDRDHGIVVDAEPAGRGRHCVVQAAGQVGGVPGHAPPDSARRGNTGAGDQRGRIVHPGEYGVVDGAQAEHRVGQRGHRARGPDSRDVGGVVLKFQQRVAGRLRDRQRHPRGIQHAKPAGQRHRQLDADRGERMPGPEVIRRERIIPDHLERAAHSAARRPLAALARPARGRPHGNGGTRADDGSQAGSWHVSTSFPPQRSEQRGSPVSRHLLRACSKVQEFPAKVPIGTSVRPCGRRPPGRAG